MLDRTEAPARSVVEALPSSGREHLVVQVDVRSPAGVAAAFEALDRELGRLDVLVNCAGVREIGSTLELPVAEWDNVIAINLSGSFYCAQQAARRMVAAGGGSIVNIASIGGFVGSANRPAYCASKHGVIGLTRSFAKDLGPHRVRVNAICPGLIRTPLTEPYFDDEEFLRALPIVIPAGRHGEPREVANAALFLASELSEYVTGAALPVDGGFLAEKTFDVTGRSSSTFMRGTSTSDASTEPTRAPAGAAEA